MTTSATGHQRFSDNTVLRAARVAAAMTAFAVATGQDTDTPDHDSNVEQLADLLCNLRHLVDALGIDFAEINRRDRKEEPLDDEPAPEPPDVLSSPAVMTSVADLAEHVEWFLSHVSNPYSSQIDDCGPDMNARRAGTAARGLVAYAQMCGTAADPPASVLAAFYADVPSLTELLGLDYDQVDTRARISYTSDHYGMCE
jgi:hypothetical protein